MKQVILTAWQSRLARSLLVSIILISSAITLALTSLQLYWEYRNGVANVNRELDQIQLTHVNTFSEELWRTDSKSIQIHLQGLTSQKTISHAVVQDMHRIWGEAGNRTVPSPLMRRYLLEHVDSGKQKQIGELVVTATLQSVYDQLIESVLITLLSNGVKTFLVAGFMLALIHLRITKPLSQLAQQAGTHNGEFNVARPAKHQEDEIDKLVSALNERNQKLAAAGIALRESDLRYRSLFNEARDMIHMLDCDECITEVNPAECRALGYSRAELVGKPLQTLIHPDYLIRTQEALAETKKGKGIDHETALISRTGKIIHVEASVTPKISGDRIVGARAILRDITERQQAEHERQRLMLQLQQAQKMESVGQLAGGLAHDFNNILASLLGYADLLQQRLPQDSTGKLAGYLNEIQTAGERARDLVAKLLLYARGSQGKVIVADALTLVQEVVNLLRATLPSTIEIRLTQTGDLHKLAIDPTQLHQIIMNLVVNGRDALNGTGRIDIRVQRHLPNNLICQSCHEAIRGEFIEIAVTDTGSGIPPEHLARIFEPFYSTKPPGRGSGLGLSVVHGIVHERGGHLHVTSTLGTGTTIRVFLPGTHAA